MYSKLVMPSVYTLHYEYFGIFRIHCASSSRRISENTINTFVLMMVGGDGQGI